MAVSPGLGITVAAGVSYYRITSLGFRTASTKHHAKVVNGEGAVRSRHGARYNYPGAERKRDRKGKWTCRIPLGILHVPFFSPFFLDPVWDLPGKRSLGSDQIAARSGEKPPWPAFLPTTIEEAGAIRQRTRSPTQVEATQRPFEVCR